MSLAAPAAVALTTSSQTIYTNTASDSVRRLVEVIVTNVDGTNAAKATLAWTDVSASNASQPFVFQANVAGGDALLSPRKVLDIGDSITGLASANGDLVAHVNVLHQE